MRSHSAWKIGLILLFGFVMLTVGYFAGRSSGTTVIYERPVTPTVQAETQTDQTAQQDEQAVPVTIEDKININTADAAQLETLPGIGPVLAQKIIEYRQTYGQFRIIDQIKDVSGIGDATFAEIEPYITVGE